MANEWRDGLLVLRAELQSIAEIGDESAAVVELDQAKVGRLSRMDAMQAQAMAQASGQRHKATLVRITAALKRLEEGDFGLCLNCDEPINPKRLAFDPTATLFIDDESVAESRDI